MFTEGDSKLPSMKLNSALNSFLMWKIHISLNSIPVAVLFNPFPLSAFPQNSMGATVTFLCTSNLLSGCGQAPLFFPITNGLVPLWLPVGKGWEEEAVWDWHVTLLYFKWIINRDIYVLSHFSCVQLCVALWTAACQAPLLWDSPDKNTGVGHHTLLQGIFPTQGSNPGLLHCRQSLYCLCHQGRKITPYDHFIGYRHVAPTP